MQLFVKGLLNYRKHSKAIHKGKTIHFAPADGVYVLFRKYKDETVAVILNKNKEPISLVLDRFKEMKLVGRTLTNIETGESLVWEKNLSLDAPGITLLTTK